MDSTCITLTPALKSHMAAGHDDKVSARRILICKSWPEPARYVRSLMTPQISRRRNRLTNSPLSPLMQQSQTIRHTDSPDFGKTAMPWVDQNAFNPPGSELLAMARHLGSTAFVGFDKSQRRGVIILSNQLYCHASPSVGPSFKASPSAKRAALEWSLK